MNTRTLLGTALLVAVVVPVAALGLSVQDPEAPLDPKVLEWDKGPARIDISKYPAEMRPKYKLFMEKCGKCHTPARAINCDLVLEDEWERYVKRMMRKSGTYITADEGKQIYEFAVYDSKVRKKELYEQRLKESKAGGF
jgi:hypothetical protein